MSGYLGKISAVVSVNNSDVKPKLDASAQAVSNFARGVERDLRSASTGASKAFDGIYTPLQKMERAMYAASTMKLSFKGFEGAIRDVDGLRSRLASLSRQRINLDVTGSGFRSIEEMRKAIGSITSKDISFVADLGGLSKAREMIAAMDDAERSILAKFDRLNSLDQIKVAIAVVGQASLDAATNKMRQAAVAAETIAKPLKQASDVAASFGLTIQQNLSPAMARVQAAAEAVKMSLGRPGAETQFTIASRQARELLAVIKQVAEAQNAVSGMKTGRELAFANPRLAAQLSSAAALGNRAAEMPEAFLSSNSNVATLVQQLNAVSQKATEAFSAVRGATNGADRASASAELAKAQGALDSLIARLSKELPLDVDTTQAVAKVDELTLKLQALSESAARAMSGKPQTMTQASSEFNRILSQFEKLNDAQRQALAPDVNSFLTAFKGGEGNLANILAALQTLDDETRKQLQINIDTAAAKAKVDGLRDSLKGVAGVVIPQRTPMEQLRIDAEEAKAAVDKVKDATAKAGLKTDLDFVATGVSRLADPTNSALAGMSDADVDRFVRDAQQRLQRIKGRAETASAPTADDVFGASIGSSKANVDGLQSKIKSLQSSIAELPVPLQARLLPALDAARQSFMALGTTPAAAAIAKASQEAEDLEAGLKRAQAAAKFSGTFASFLDDTAADRYVAKLNTIRQSLLAVGATASGPVANAIDAYQRALYDAGEAGVLGTDATKKQMDSLLQKIAQVAFQTEKQRTAFVQMVQSSGRGDVSRMGADKANLALQQAAFAVDDFMSSTGGVEHRIRAISNNLTQMAFILGSTKGLWLAVGATMATTIAIPILKAIFQFEDMESRLKALNGELEKSQNIAERTAESYKELAKALREAGAGGIAGKADSFVQERRREAMERAQSAALRVNPQFARTAGLLEEKKTALEKTTDTGDRAALIREIESLQKTIAEMRQRSLDRASPGDLSKMLEKSRQAEIAALGTSVGSVSDSFTGGNAAALLRSARNRAAPNLSSSSESLKSLDEQIAGLRESLKKMPVADFIGQRAWSRLHTLLDLDLQIVGLGEGLIAKTKDVRQQIQELEAERARIEQDVALSRNEGFMPRAMAAAAAAELTPQARERVGRLGLDSDVTAKFDKDLSDISKHFGDVIVELEKAVREGRDTSALEAEADKAAQALEYLYQAADRYASAVALGAIVPTQQRLERAGEQLSGVGASNVATAIARAQARRAEVEEELSRAKARDDGMAVAAAELELEQIRNHTSRLEAASVATAAFQRALEDAAGALSTTLVQEAQSREQELRRGMNRGFVGAEDAYGEARAEADRQEARDRQLRIDMNRERLAFEQSFAGDPELTALANRVRDGRDVAGDRTKSAAEQEAGRLDAEAAQAELDRRFENRPEVVALRERVNAADAEVAIRNQDIERANEQRRRAMGGIDAAARRNVANADRGIPLAAPQFMPAAELERQLKLAREASELQRMQENAESLGIDTSALDDSREDLRARVERQSFDLMDNAVQGEKVRASRTDSTLERARGELGGVDVSDLQGRITEADVRRQMLEQMRDDAIAEGTQEGDARAVELQTAIDAIVKTARALERASIAVGGFQRAMEAAALDLQNSVAGEAAGRANDARRQANETEAVFGVGSPEGQRARAKQERAEQAMRDAEEERRSAEDAIREERVKFEKELRDDPRGEAAPRAEKIKEAEDIAADETRSAEDRAKARADADRLRAEQEAAFEARPEVQAQRKRADDADREMQRRLSAERGFELARSEEEKKREDIRRQAGDLGNMVEAIVGRGKAGRAFNLEATQLATKGAINMARDAAPLYAQLTEEVMNARLQGPSRAALNVSDISTSQGAAELNRLVRGEDSAKDVNLAELKRQSNLLEAIEKAVKESAGVTVTL